MLNESESPAENVTEEIEQEKEEHQFFFQLSANNASIDYDDVDADGNPVGLLTSVQTDSTGHNMLTVTLRHEPNKNANGVSNGDITNAGGETDIEVMFHLHVK